MFRSCRAVTIGFCMRSNKLAKAQFCPSSTSWRPIFFYCLQPCYLQSWNVVACFFFFCYFFNWCTFVATLCSKDSAIVTNWVQNFAIWQSSNFYWKSAKSNVIASQSILHHQRKSENECIHFISLTFATLAKSTQDWDKDYFQSQRAQSSVHPSFFFIMLRPLLRLVRVCWTPFDI